MGNILHTLQKTWNELNKQERSILFATFCLFLPFQIGGAFLVVILAYEWIKTGSFAWIKDQPGALWLYSFVGLECIVSIVNQNWIGLLNVFGFLLIGLFIAYYRSALSMRLFQMIILEVLLLSWLCAIYGLVEFYGISKRLGNPFFDFVVMNKPKDRIAATFYNANFYATMIEFVLCFCIYSFIVHKKAIHRAFYIGTGFLNLFMLYLTGCRTAILPFVIIIPLFFLLSKEKVWFYVSLLLEGIVAALISWKPQLIPRFDQMSTFSSRLKIWKASWIGIQEHPWFGQGPQTYSLVYRRLHAHKAPHAHNILIDCILSYGILGTLLLIGYVGLLLHEQVNMYKREKNYPLFALIVSFYCIALIHGLLDVTLNFLPTGCLFLMILNASAQFPLFKTKKIDYNH